MIRFTLRTDCLDSWGPAERSIGPGAFAWVLPAVFAYENVKRSALFLDLFDGLIEVQPYLVSIIFNAGGMEWASDVLSI